MENKVSQFFSSFIYFALAFFIVAFGVPAWSEWLGLAAAACGYALLWKSLLPLSSQKRRFWYATAWFAAVQLVQLFWMTSHPFWYIYIIYFLISLCLGLQFGLITILITPERIKNVKNVAGIAALWVVLEWSRYFFLSGFSFGLVGMHLAGSIVTLQFASLGGVLGLSLWVMLTNLLAMRALLYKTYSLWAVFVFIPFLFGFAHLYYHNSQLEKSPSFEALLVQTGFPVEENQSFDDIKEIIQYVLEEWKQIAIILQRHQAEATNLIAIPEGTVPFGAFTPIFPHESVKEIWLTVFGEQALAKLPVPQPPFAQNYQEGVLVSNAYLSQALANLLKTPVAIGLQHGWDEESSGNRVYSQSAFYFSPHGQHPKRYDKRVLIPMGEYIPFSFLRDLAAMYGVHGFFTHGDKAHVWDCGNAALGISICYEETFGHLMRDNRLLGANMLLNLTSDAWFPSSSLPQQHFDLARLRTVELGVPMIRSCNTGITCAVDSLGRTVAELGENHPNQQWLSDAIKVDVPTYHYKTLYAQFGDLLVLGICCLALLFWAWPIRFI